jgi:large subunit ribosomal protein L35
VKLKGRELMPKMKSNRGAAKRFRKTAKGKIRCDKPFSSHILTKKSTTRKRKLRKNDTVHASLKRQVQRLLPYL